MPVTIYDEELDEWQQFLIGKRPKWPPIYEEPTLRFGEKIIRHEGGKWILYARDGKRKLGEFDTKEEALERERQIQYFVHQRKATSTVAINSRLLLPREKDMWNTSVGGQGQKVSGEGETRGENASARWADDWHRSFPPSGTGQWIFHHHWRGLSKDEIELDNYELMKTDHSVHGDLRFTGPVQLWGISIFLGKASDNVPNERMLDQLSPQKPLQVTFKLPQPKEWLEVGRGKPYVAEPEQAGATNQTYAKFFAMDYGRYQMGVWRSHLFEIFLHGSKLKGRYLIEYAPIAGRRIWLVTKPEDQTPYAESHDLDDVKTELKKKGQEWLIWAKPGERPQKIRI